MQYDVNRMIDYTESTKLRRCLKCSNVFKSMHAGNRICEVHRKEENYYYQPDTWGNIPVEVGGCNVVSLDRRNRMTKS